MKLKAVMTCIHDTETNITTMVLDGLDTHTETINDAEELTNFLEHVLSEYAWWIPEAWQHSWEIDETD